MISTSNKSTKTTHQDHTRRHQQDIRSPQKRHVPNRISTFYPSLPASSSFPSDNEVAQRLIVNQLAAHGFAHRHLHGLLGVELCMGVEQGQESAFHQGELGMILFRRGPRGGLKQVYEICAFWGRFPWWGVLACLDQDAISQNEIRALVAPPKKSIN